MHYSNCAYQVTTLKIDMWFTSQMIQGQGDHVIELIDRKAEGVNRVRNNELFVQTMCHTTL